MVAFMALPRYLRQSHSGTVPNIIHPNGFSVNPSRSLEPFHKFFKHVSRKAPPAHTDIPSVASKRTTGSTPSYETNSQNKNEVQRPRLISFLCSLILVLLFDLKQDVPTNDRSDNSTDEIKGEKTANKTHNGSIEY